MDIKLTMFTNFMKEMKLDENLSLQEMNQLNDIFKELNDYSQVLENKIFPYLADNYEKETVSQHLRELGQLFWKLTDQFSQNTEGDYSAIDATLERCNLEKKPVLATNPSAGSTKSLFLGLNITTENVGKMNTQTQDNPMPNNQLENKPTQINLGQQNKTVEVEAEIIPKKVSP